MLDSSPPQQIVKRKLEDSSVAPENTRESKKVRFSPGWEETVTGSVYHQLKTQHGLDLTLSQFVDLCAYLCALLRREFTIFEDEMDLFMLSYQTFEKSILVYETAIIQGCDQIMPAYHEWFVEEVQSRVEHCQGSSMVNESTLREIWAENYFSFLSAEWTLGRIAVLNQLQADTANGDEEDLDGMELDGLG